jgi:hypothetical protein
MLLHIEPFFFGRLVSDKSTGRPRGPEGQDYRTNPSDFVNMCDPAPHTIMSLSLSLNTLSDMRGRAVSIYWQADSVGRFSTFDFPGNPCRFLPEARNDLSVNGSGEGPTRIWSPGPPPAPVAVDSDLVTPPDLSLSHLCAEAWFLPVAFS